MEEFTERHHAYLVGRFYQELKKQAPERAEAAFVLCTQRYAEQRGSRMAQRAVRDGRPLDFTTYREYGEWRPSETVRRAGGGNLCEVQAWSPDCIEKIYRCPWAAQFEEMGLRDCGMLYCRHIDRSIVRGFNPELVFELTQSIYESGCCVQVLRGAGFAQGQTFDRRAAYQKAFDYHCAHCYKTFRELLCAIFGVLGESISVSVLLSFEKAYGREQAQVLLALQREDFNLI